MDAAERLLQFIDFKGFGEGRKGKSLRQFYNSVDLSMATFKAGRLVSSEALYKVYDKFPELNTDWVITGRGEMLYSDKPQMIVGASGEGAEIAISVLKDELSETRAKLIRCLEEKERFVAGYGNINLNEPVIKKEKAE